MALQLVDYKPVTMVKWELFEISGRVTLRKKFRVILVRIFPYSLRIRENTDQNILGAETFAIFAIFAHFRESFCLRK